MPRLKNKVLIDFTIECHVCDSITTHEGEHLDLPRESEVVCPICGAIYALEINFRGVDTRYKSSDGDQQ